MVEIRKLYEIEVEKPEDKRRVGTRRHTRENKTKLGVKRRVRRFRMDAFASL
jgi:hypothetical protein